MTPMSLPCELSFVPYDEDFLQRSFTWFKDEELRRLTNAPEVTREKQQEWFASLPEKHDYLIWGVRLGVDPVGACGLKKVTASDAEYWGYLGEKHLWGKGLGRQLVEFCLLRARQMGLRRVWLTVNAENRRAIALYGKMGFSVVRRDADNLVMERVVLSGGVAACGLVDLPKIGDPRGNLTFVEGGIHVPFDIKRVYYLYDVPGGSERGGHAHKALHQLIVAMSGSFDVVLDDGCQKKRFHLARSYYGLYVCPMIWRELTNFSSGSVCMVLASNRYDEDDYYRDYPGFMSAVKEGRGEGQVVA